MQRRGFNVVSHLNMFTFKYAVPPIQIGSNGSFSWLLAPKVTVPERLMSIDLGNFWPKITSTSINYKQVNCTANEKWGKKINKTLLTNNPNQ